MKKVFSQIQMTTWIKEAGVKPMVWKKSPLDQTGGPNTPSWSPVPVSSLVKEDHKASLRA